MAKEIQYWACDKCGNTYESKSVAELCEKKHVDFQELTFHSARYDRIGVGHQPVPRELIFTWSLANGGWIRVSYKLDNMGTKGV